MSMWTHITACLSVDTHIQDKNILALVAEYLKGAPHITGSERDADVFVNLQSGYNTWTSADCEHCEYKKNKKYIAKGEYECNHPEDYECQEGEYQTCVTISIQGDLRDRTKLMTEGEFQDFKEYLEKEYTIRDYSLNIEGE